MVISTPLEWSLERNEKTRVRMNRLGLAVLFIAVSLWAAVGQKPARLVADGTVYHAVASQYAAGATVVTAEAPFVSRIATPWLASRLDPYVQQILPARLELAIEEANGLKGFPGFYAVNILASLVATLLLYRYLGFFVTHNALRLFLVGLWLIQWHGPVRFSYFYPAYVDPLFTALLFGALIVIEQSAPRRLATSSAAVSALTFVAALSRETAFLIPILFLARHWYQFAKPTRAIERAVLMLPFVALVCGLIVVRQLTRPEGPFDPLYGPLQMLREKPIYTWILAWFFAFGPAAVAVILSAHEEIARRLRERRDLVVCLVAAGVLAYVGGTDTERILIWAWPVVLVLLAWALQYNAAALARSPLLCAALLIIALVSARIFWAVPSGVEAQTPTSALRLDWESVVVLLDKTLVMHNYYANSWSFFGSRALHAAQLAFDLVLTAALLMLIRRARTRTLATARAADITPNREPAEVQRRRWS